VHKLHCDGSINCSTLYTSTTSKFIIFCEFVIILFDFITLTTVHSETEKFK